MARVNIGGRLMYLYRTLTGERHSFSGGRWDDFLKAQRDRKKFQDFLADRLHRLHPDQTLLMYRYYVQGLPASGTDRVRLVEVKKTFASHLTSDEVWNLKELMR